MEQEEEAIEEKSEAQKKSSVDKAQSTTDEIKCVGNEKEEEVKEKGKKRNESPRAKQFLGRSGRWLFFHLILMQNWLCVDAAAERLKPKGEAAVPETIIVPDAVEGTFADLDGKRIREEQKDKNYREWKRSKKELTRLK